MGNQIQAALEKVAKLEERKAKMAAIFEKSETKRQGTLDKLHMLIERTEKKAGEIAAKKDKVLLNLDLEIEKAKEEEKTLKAEIMKVVDAQKNA